jgi:Rad3-related DNA helicase
MTGMNNEERLVFRLVNPIPVLENGYARVHASLSMSGTLGAPTDDYRELRYQLPLFGLPRGETLIRTYASPFPSEHQRWFFNAETYGTSQEREKHLSRYAEQIVEVGKETPRVTAVFFSSYHFLTQVQNQITDPFEKHIIIPEEQADAKGNDSEFVDLAGYENQLRSLVKEHERAYLFAVYKGRLAEGADFGGNLIKTVVGISIPLEYTSLYHQKLQQLFEKQCAPIAEELGDELSQKAKEYTRDRLSLSLVLQACGRGIRSEHDRCAFVLLDKRYEDYNWRRFLESKPFNVPQIGYSVASFHKKSQKPDSGQWDKLLLDACRKGEE